LVSLPEYPVTVINISGRWGFSGFFSEKEQKFCSCRGASNNNKAAIFFNVIQGILGFILQAGDHKNKNRYPGGICPPVLPERNGIHIPFHTLDEVHFRNHIE